MLANVCKLFHDMLSEGEVKEIMCWPMEKPTLSTVPASHQSFKRNLYGRKDRRGGGAVIPCKFVLTCFDSCYERIRERLIKVFCGDAFQGTERIED